LIDLSLLLHRSSVSVSTCVYCYVSADGLEISHRPRHCAVVTDDQCVSVVAYQQTDVMYYVTSGQSVSLTSCPHWSVMYCGLLDPTNDVSWRRRVGYLSINEFFTLAKNSRLLNWIVTSPQYWYTTYVS